MLGGDHRISEPSTVSWGVQYRGIVGNMAPNFWTSIIMAIKGAHPPQMPPEEIRALFLGEWHWGGGYPSIPRIGKQLLLDKK